MYTSYTWTVVAALAAVTAAETTCNNGQQNGICISTDSCDGTATPGYCPGSSDIQCCTYGTCTANGVSGTCESTSTCSGDTTSGLCPGPSDIECCTASSGGGGGTGCPPSLNDASINLIKSFEKFEPSPYDDGYGFITVGYGHKCADSSCSDTGYSYPMSEAEGEALLDSDQAQFKNCVRNYIGVPFNDDQYGATVSFTFNLGCGTLQKSTFLSRVNAGEEPDGVAAAEFPKYTNAGGVSSPGLVRRRQAEVSLFQTDSDVQAIPC